MEKLANANLNLDRGFVIPLSERTDDRDSRPMQYPGKIALPMALDPEKQPQRYANGFWSTTPLWACGACQPAPMLRTRDMKQIDLISEDAAPTTTDMDTHANPAEKTFQLGGEVMHKFLHSILTGSKAAGRRRSILVVDLFPHTTDVTRAFVDLLPLLPNTSVFYRGMCASEDEKEWAQDAMQRYIRDAFLSGKISISGQTPMPAEIPPEMLEAAPAKPALHALTWVEQDDQRVMTVKVPDPVLQTWHDHNKFGDDFQKWLNCAETQQALTATAEDKSVDTAGTPKKRNLNPDSPSPQILKKQKSGVGEEVPQASQI